MNAATSQAKPKPLLETFVEQMPCAVAMFDRDMNYLAWSRRWSEGLNANPHRGHNFFQTLAHCQPSLVSAQGKALRGHSEAWVETQPSPDGKVVLRRRWEMKPHVDETEEISGLLLTYHELDELGSQESEPWREAQRQGGLGHWVLDIASGHVTWSAELRRMAGLQPDDQIPSYEVHGQLYTVESWDRITAAVQKAVDFGQSYEEEIEMLPRGSDSKLWVIARAKPLRDEDGKVYRLVGTCQDIHSRKMAELELKAYAEKLELSERRFRGIFNNTSQFLGLLTTDGAVLEINDTAMRLSDQPLAELVGMPFWETPWWRHSGALQELVREAVDQARAGVVTSSEVNTPDLEGGLVDVHFSLRPIHDDAGKVVFLVPEGRDVTQERKFQDALAESESRFRSAFEYAGLGISIVSLEGRYLEVNSALCEIVGYSQSELLQMGFRELTHPDDAEGDQVWVRELIHGTHPFYQREKRYFHKSGKLIWVFVTVSLMRNVNGDPLYFIAQTKDISQRKEAEETLKHSLAEKEVMLREIHHRVKNNLQVVISLLQLQSHYVSDPKVIDALRECQGRIHSMAQVHQRLYSSDSFTTLDFGAHLQELATLTASGHTPGGTEIALDVQISAVPLSLETAVPLGLIANELLTNAYRHAFVGRTRGHLRVGLHNVDNEVVVLTVEDDGVGLPAEFSVEKSTGSLGLRLIKTLARQLRAEVSGGPSELGGASLSVKVYLSKQSN